MEPAHAKVARTEPPVQAPSPEAYAALIVKKPALADAQQSEVLFPLVVAYLMSSHIRFLFLLDREAVPLLDSLYDEILRALPLDSKGLLYVEEGVENKFDEFLRGAQFVVTNHPTVQLAAQSAGIPVIFVRPVDGTAPVVQLSGMEGIRDGHLRESIGQCAETVNARAEEFVADGPFYLWW
jgi:hypothetical protein